MISTTALQQEHSANVCSNDCSKTNTGTFPCPKRAQSKMMQKKHPQTAPEKDSLLEGVGTVSAMMLVFQLQSNRQVTTMIKIMDACFENHVSGIWEEPCFRSQNVVERRLYEGREEKHLAK